MAAILQLLHDRQSAFDGQLAQNHALVSKDLSSAFYTDSNAVADCVEPAKMVSWWRIATMSMDREGDVLVPSGCLGTIQTFVENPVVCFDHKRDYKLPIGKSVGHGALPLDVRENEIVAGCLHDDTTQFSRDVWQLVVKGLLRAASVSFVPLSGERVRQKAQAEEGHSFSPRYKFHQWNLTEWSICTVGINPEAVRIELSSGGLKSPEILKSLSAVAQKPSIWANGFNPEVDAMVSLDKINREAVGSLRFHKSHFVDGKQCQAWLQANGFDTSLMVDNPKSMDYIQVVGDLGEKSDKVEKGVYVVYLKAFPPKKKDDDTDDETKKKEKPPFPDTAKPSAGKPDDKTPAKKPGDQEVEDRDDHEVAAKKDASVVDKMDQDDAVDKDAPLDDDKAMDDQEDKPVDDQDQVDDPAAPKDGDGDPGELTNAGYALVDILRHKMGELEFYRQSLKTHDHDGLKQMMTEELKNCQEAHDKWLAGAKKMFPDVDFEKLAASPGDEPQDEPMDDEKPADPDSTGDIRADALDPLKKAMSDMSEDDWDDLAISLALADFKL